MTRTLNISVGLALISLVGCGEKPAPAQAAPYSVVKDSVKIEEAAAKKLRFVTAPAELDVPLPMPPITGHVTTVETLTFPAYSPLSGRVATVNVRLGDRVKAGQQLIEIKSAELPTLERELKAAELAAKTKAALVERTRQLVAARAAPENDLVVAESELAEAKLAETTARTRLRTLAVGSAAEDSYWILASRAGTVVQLEVTPGMVVGPDKDRPLVTVADLDEVVVIGDVPQRDAVGLTPGIKAVITFPGGTSDTVEGTLETVSEVVDPDRQTVPVRIRAPNLGRQLRPNSYVDLTLVTGQAGKLVQVPTDAIVSDGAQSVVFVEEGAGVFRRRPVTVRRQNKDKAEISAGLTAGEKVVVVGALLLLNAINVEG
ncbi:MAG: efflux RND transporter periplasmic adaptor subunit [Myxococcota bacterium]